MRADLRSYLAAEGADEHVSAASLTVTFDPAGSGGRRPINLAAGTTRFGGGRPVTADARWQIASNTKAFTSVLLLKLEAQGVLSVDDEIGTWLPQYPAWRRITIRQLLNMTSGIPDFTELPAFTSAYFADPKRDFTADQLVSYAYGLPLGHGYGYSNTNYIIAEQIIERATHDSYADQLTTRILKPLRLRDTCYGPVCPARTAARMPAGYYAPAPGQATSMPVLALTAMQAAGGIVASLPDLARWERALYHGELLPPRQQRELESLVSVETGLPISTTTPSDPHGYGLGVGQVTSPVVGKAWVYEGETSGFRSVIMYVPSSGVLVSLALNSGGVAEDHLPQLLLKVYQDLTAAKY
ncbi:serine hydrolase domain-containing protein [Catenulispora subtropica]|uniref:Serine hydrolase domain-containing protein n=1 Tax=Catenulispora subtropica TaxID=450798 RepID=A0ABN2R5Z9_9ACTN